MRFMLYLERVRARVITSLMSWKWRGKSRMKKPRMEDSSMSREKTNLDRSSITCCVRSCTVKSMSCRSEM